MQKPDKDYSIQATLEEFKLIKRLRQLRNQGDGNVLLVDADDCREVGTLKRGKTKRHK